VDVRITTCKVVGNIQTREGVFDVKTMKLRIFGVPHYRTGCKSSLCRKL